MDTPTKPLNLKEKKDLIYRINHNLISLDFITSYRTFIHNEQVEKERQELSKPGSLSFSNIDIVKDISARETTIPKEKSKKLNGKYRISRLLSVFQSDETRWQKLADLIKTCPDRANKTYLSFSLKERKNFSDYISKNVKFVKLFGLSDNVDFIDEKAWSSVPEYILYKSGKKNATSSVWHMNCYSKYINSSF